MADYTTLQGVNPTNVRELMRQDASFQTRQNVTGEPFSKALGIASDVMSLAGPVAGASTPFMGMKGAAITSAALSGFGVQGGGVSTPGFGGVGYGMGKALSAPGAAPGYPGSASAYGGSSGSTMNIAGGQDTSQFNSQVDMMMNQNMTFLALQTKVQNVSQVSQMMSNLAKTDSDAKLNAIRNVRA